MKKGDKVIYIGGSEFEESNRLRIGGEYEIDEAEDDCIKLKGKEYWNGANFFKLKTNKMNYPKAIIKKCEPEVTKDEVVIDECRLVEVERFEQVRAKGTGRWIIGESLGFKKKAVVLNSEFEYVLAIHEGASYLFIQEKKENS